MDNGENERAEHFEGEATGGEHTGDGPLDRSRDPLSKGDLASTARWLDARRAAAQADMVSRVERHSGALRVTNDHLVLIRSDIAGLLGEMAQGFDTAGRDRDRLCAEIRNRRGRIRWLLAALLGFSLGLAVPVEPLVSGMLRLLGAQ